MWDQKCAYNSNNSDITGEPVGKIIGSELVSIDGGNDANKFRSWVVVIERTFNM